MRKPGVVKKCGTMCEVSVLRQSACGENCAHCKGGCTPTDTIITAENMVGAEVGDRVILEVPDRAGIKAAALVYSLPIAVLIIALMTAKLSGMSDDAAALISLAAMAVSLGVVSAINRHLSSGFKVQIVDIIGRGENTVEK